MLILALLLCLQGERKTENVVLVTLDGFRWQEVYGGAEERLISKELGRVEDVDDLRRRYWRDTPEARRRALLPFLWSEIAGKGQLIGNAAKGSEARVTNGLKFSYPGYAELLGGFADPRIDSNKKIPNPNPTVLEWMSKRPGYAGKVAAFCAWDVFPAILNRERSGLPTLESEGGLYGELAAEISTPWRNCRHDALTFRPALDHLKKQSPRVLYVALGETDEWAHHGRYDRYLEAAAREDAYLKLLWETLQGMPAYAGKTALLVTTDHGRGHEGASWRDHGKSTVGAERIWIAAIGPDILPKGERTEIPDVLQSQIAATVAALLGEDYRRDVPQAAAPLAPLLER